MYSDVTVAVWMMGFNATHLDDPRLCTQDCNAGIVVYNGTILGTCNGLCDVLVEAPQLHVCGLCTNNTAAYCWLQTLPTQHRPMRHVGRHCQREATCQCYHRVYRLWMPATHQPRQQQQGHGKSCRNFNQQFCVICTTRPSPKYTSYTLPDSNTSALQ